MEQLDNNLKNTKTSKSSLSGFTSLITIIILSAVVISVIFMGSIISIDNNKFNRVANDSIIAGRIAHSCAEVALNKLKSDSNYIGSEVIDLDPADGVICNVLAVSGIENTNRVLKISAVTTTNVVKKIQIYIDTINPTFIFTSWQEVADFI